MKKKLSLNSPLYVTRRMNISKRNAWFIRGGSILFAILMSAIISTCLRPGSFGTFFQAIFEGTFGTTSFIFNLLCALSVYLLLALAVTPAFRMKFWNIGAEGQALAGCIVTAPILLLLPQSIPDSVVIIIALIASLVAGAIWAVIPTIFKIKFNTNETLFTLLMNYVAMAIAGFVVAELAQGSTQQFPPIPKGRTIIQIGDVKFLPFIIAALLITAFMLLYLNKSKQGYELSVMGDSRNTAKYAGMSISKITLRTMIMSGAIAGLVGFLIVCGRDKTLSPDLVGGRGFTSVLIAWLGHFNPSEIALYSFVVAFLDKGIENVASKIDVSKNYFSGVIIGLFIIILVIAEFFVRFKVNIRHKHTTITKNDDKNNIETDNNKPNIFRRSVIKLKSLKNKIFKNNSSNKKAYSKKKESNKYGN